jgi:hypothetical protein
MPERNSWAVSDTPDGVITTEDARIALSALMQTGPSAASARDGVRPGAGEPGRVSAVAPTPNRTVTVAPFQMFMRPSRGTGSYIQTLDAVKTLDLLTDHPSHPSNARIDLIVAQQSDEFYGDNSNAFVVRHVAGEPSGSPTDPDVDGSPDAVLLARVRIPAGATAITEEMIENEELEWAVGLGGLLPVRTVAERDTVDAYPGAQVYRRDRRWTELHDGGAWRVPSIPVCSSLADITAAFGSPYLGQAAFSTGDNLLYRWDGSAWVGAVATGGAGTATRHEARYEIRTAQSFPSGDNRIAFPFAVYTTSDVTPTSNNIFTLNRAGLWHISASTYHNTPGVNHFTYLGIVNGASIGVRYANAQHYNATGHGAMNVSTVQRFTVGAQVSAIFWHDVTTGAIGLNTAMPNNITLTWLRP